MSDRDGSVRSDRSRASRTGTTGTRHEQTRGERLLHWFPELGKSLLRESEPGLESLLHHIQSLRGQVSKRAQETGRDLEARAERLLADLEKQAVRGLRPLLSRAQVASQGELERLERRIAHLEGRIGPLLNDRAELATRLADLERHLEEARADASERLREIDVRLAARDDLGVELAGVREHLDALSKEQVTRGLDLGKLHDRIVRLEMRFGEVLKEQGTQLTDHQDVKSRLGNVVREVGELAERVRTAGERALESATLGRTVSDRLTALGDQRALDRGVIERVDRRTAELERRSAEGDGRTGQLDGRTGELERVIRQLDLRLGDLAERHAATREELAALVGRLRQLETPPAPARPVVERSEGH